MLSKDITKEIVNEFDVKATSVIITDYNAEDEAVTCDLYVADKRIVTKRVYSLAKIPLDFIAGDLEYLRGEIPDIKWNVPAIKCWLADHQTGEEEMAVDGDPYLYMSEAELLALVLELTELEK